MKRVYVVEDEAVVAMELKDHLRALGYVPCGHAARGDVALAEIPTARPDLVLMDIQLAGELSGIDVAERLRGTCDVPVVFLTAFIDVEDAQRAGRSTSYAYLAKPFEERELGVNIELALARHAAVRALHESEAQFRAIFEQAAVGVAEVDVRTGRFLRVNRMYGTIVGRPVEELVGMDAMVLSPPEDRPVGFPLIRALEAGSGGERSAERRVLRPDGEIAWVEVSVSPLWASGEPPTRVLCVITDITVRKRAAAALAASEERYRRLFEEAVEGIYELRVDRTLAQCNPAFARMLGAASPAALVGQSLQAAADEVLPGAGEAGALAGGEAVWRRVDGALVYVERFERVVCAPGGEVVGYHGMARDVTARVVAEQARARLEEQLRHAQKMESLGTLANGIAHDFNNLLAIILADVELARGAVAEARPVGDLLDEVEIAATRASQLVKQVRAFSKQQPVHRRVVGAAALVEEAARFLRAALPAAIHLAVEIPADAPSVLVDPAQLHQVLMNLGTNAWHAIEPGTGEITVQLAATTLREGEVAGLPAGPYARIAVRDTGAGIDPLVRDRIFEPFFTTKGIGKGTGMGLAVAHGIVAGHAGAITVESAPGAGAVFTIWVPAVRVAPAASPPVAVEPGRVGGRALLLDDEVLLLRIGTRILTKLGYEVVGFAQPGEALAAVRAQPELFDIVVTDQNMPGMSGLELAAAIAGIRADLPVVLVSGAVRYTDAELVAANIRAFVPKPYTIDSLRQALVRVRATAAATAS